MSKNNLLFSCLIAACLLGWAGLLPVKGYISPSYGKPKAQKSINVGKQDFARSGQKDNDEQEDNGDRNDRENKEGGGEDEGGGEENGNGGDSGEGPDGNPNADIKKISYKDAMARAAKYTAQKKYASASMEYNKALTGLAEDDVRKVYIYERQGWLALMGKDISSAEGFYLAAIYQAEKVETYDKNAVNAYRGAAYCYEKNGNISSAVENYQLALKHATDKSVKADIRKNLQRLQAGKRKKAR